MVRRRAYLHPAYVDFCCCCCVVVVVVVIVIVVVVLFLLLFCICHQTMHLAN